MFWADYTFLLLIPPMIIAMIAQMRVSSAFNKYSKIKNRSGITGAQAARMLLDGADGYNVEGLYGQARPAGTSGVAIESVRGRLSDHYDPRSKTLRLSEAVYGDTSLAAVGVAAHETGHALQDAEGYAPLAIRSAIVPITQIGSFLAWPIFIIGLFITYSADAAGGSYFGELMISAGILLYAMIVVFTLITLPVEFNASKRAVAMLESGGILAPDEVEPVRKVLNAAALTYVAATFMAIMQLLRILAIANRRR